MLELVEPLEPLQFVEPSAQFVDEPVDPLPDVEPLVEPVLLLYVEVPLEVPVVFELSVL